MFVKLKTGARAGEIHEVKFETARELLASGRAEKVNYDPPQAAEAPSQSVPRPAPAKLKKGKKR